MCERYQLILKKGDGDLSKVVFNSNSDSTSAALKDFTNSANQLNNVTIQIKANSNSLSVAELEKRFKQFSEDIILTGGGDKNSPATVLKDWRDYTDATVFIIK